MTAYRNESIAALAVAALLAVMTGAFVVAAPPVAIVACATLALAAVISFGVQALLILVLVAFPLLPSDAFLAVSSQLDPQRVAIGVLLLGVAADRRVWSQHAWRLRRLGTPLRFFAAFLAIGLLSAVGSPLPGSAAFGVIFYGVHLGGALLAGCILARAERTDDYLAAICIGALFVSLLALLAYLFPASSFTHILGPTFSTNEANLGATRALDLRVSGPLGHPVSLGAYGVLTLPFALRAAVSSRPRVALLGKSAVALLLVAVLLSQTRIAIIAAAVVLAVWFALSEKRREALGLGVVTGLVILLTFGGSFFTTQSRVLTSLATYRSGSTSSDTAVQNLSSRTSIYETGWRAFQAKPVLGYGMRVPTGHAQSPFFARFGQPYAFESYLVVLPLEVGLVGVAAFLGFLATLVAAVRRNFPDRHDRAAVYAALAGGGVLAIAATAFGTEVTYFWLMLGIMLAAGLRPSS